jgi:hypothetical protein
MKARHLAIAALAFGRAFECAGAEIFRCSTPNGSISYQEIPCAPNSDAGKVDVPSIFPDIDIAARERLLQREAALDHRLEAQRERLSREEMARISARAQVAAARALSAPASEPVYVYAAGWPIPMTRTPFSARRIHPHLLLR